MIFYCLHTEGIVRLAYRGLMGNKIHYILLKTGKIVYTLSDYRK